MATTGFDQLAAAGVANAREQAQRKGASDMLQRQFIASQYDNIINAPLPDANADPKAYQDAVDRKSKALEARQKVYSPDHHASLAEHLHGLITGKLNNGQAPGKPPVSAQSPQMNANSAQTNELGATLPAQQGAPAEPPHPFAHNPVYQGLIDRLKAFKNPEPPKAGTDWNSIAQGQAAGENTARQLALGGEDRKQANALEIEKAKAKDAQDLADRKKRPVIKPYMVNGKPQWLDASDPDNIPSGAEAIANTGKPKDSQAALAVYIRAKYGDNPTWQEIAQGTQEHQRLMAGVTVGQHQTVQFDADGVPHVITLQSTSGKTFGGAPPVSSEAPQVPDGMSGPNARLNAKKPQSKQVPTAPNQLDFRKATPAGNDAKKQSDAAERSYLDVQSASPGDPTGKHLDPVSSQGILLSWLRGRVNRVTQSEIQTINNMGGIVAKLEGDAVKIVSGTMSPQQYQWFLNSAKNNFENAKKVENKRTGPVSSQAPQSPSSLDDRLSKALE